MEATFRGRIRGAFSVTGRGTFLTFSLDFEGRIRIGDRVSVPVRDGSFSELVVVATEFVDSVGTGEAWLALGIGPQLAPSSISVGAIAVSV